MLSVSPFLLSLPLSLYIYTSAYVSICTAFLEAHTTKLYEVGEHKLNRLHTSAYVSIRQHTSAYVSIRQHHAIIREVGDDNLNRLYAGVC